MTIKLFIVLCIIFVIENLYLICKKYRFLSRTKRFVSLSKEKGIFFAIKKTFFLIKNKFKKGINKKQNVAKTANGKKNEKSRKIKLYLVPQGGYGDLLIFANWFQYFYDKFALSGKLDIDIYGKNGLKNIFNYPIENVHLYVPDEKNDIYDLGITMYRFPVIDCCNDNLVVSKHPALFEFVEKCRQYYEENKIFIENKPYLDGLLDSRTEIKGIKRYQQPDIYNFFDIKENFIFKIKFIENEKKYLSSIGLNQCPFITVHRGWDSTFKKSVKAWSLKSCGNLIEELKKEFPEYKIVVFGEDRKQSMPTDKADIDLLEKTSLDQVKILLKNATVHIDNEGGMVHLRHALSRKPSVVLFGPTSKEFFGYSENINVSSNKCAGCEWLINDWMLNCAKGVEGVPCMDGISTNDVINAVKKILK